MESFTPAMKLVVSLSSLQAQLLKRVDQKLSIHGISFTEYMVIYRLRFAPENTMRRIDLADSIGLTASGVTRLLMPMQKIGLVQKEVNPRDARVSLVKLSDTGKQIFEDASISFGEISDAIMQPLETAQLVDFLELVESL